ncbi:UNVERIFIED_CONTAM: putative disease resistance protein [Sesamum radiatum]|uniref:Disease resistance protein n=1 Tax=Sesamum radiatum TaxID=300843 RepID=A0AAW2JQL7_SESRA
MAYAAVTSLLQTLDLVIFPNAYLTPQDDEQFASLREKLRYLKDFLEDFVRSRDHGKVKVLERQIEDSVNRAEDIVETYLYTVRSTAKSKNSRRKEYKIFQEGLKQVIGEIDSVKKEAIEICGNPCDPNNLHSGRYLFGSSSWHVPSSGNPVVGLDNDLVKIKDQLTGLPYNLEILTIVGMAGIGKSTLAKIVYDDPLIVYHFYVRAWITVSQDYEVKNILIGLIRSVAQLTDDISAKYDDSEQHYKVLKDGINQLSDQKLAEQLYRSLKGKRSRMGITEVEGLPKTRMPLELEEIGKQIVEKCQGLPLAIVVVAGHLSKLSKKRDLWLSVADNVGSLVARNREQFLNIIAMSYNHLPHHLKACFLYMGAFPENVEIPVWRLITLWIAEGFLKRELGKSVEKVAQECLEDLIDRSLILAEKRTNERVTTCRMHDLLRDFCLREAEKESFWHVMRRHDLFFPEGLQNHRRLCVQSDIFSYAITE